MSSRKLKLRLAREAARVARLEAMLAEPSGATPAFLAQFDGTEFERLHRRARVLRNPATWGVLLRLLEHRNRWIRPLAQWRPAGRGPKSVAADLVAHLLCRYRLPTFWFSIWFAEPDAWDEELGNVFLALGRGEGLFRLTDDYRAWPPWLTRRECHLLSRQPAHNTVVSAVRSVHVAAAGGHGVLRRAVTETPWGHEFGHRHEEQWRREAVRWMVRERLPAADVRRVVHLLAGHACRRWERLLLDRGRTAVIRDAHAWEAVAGPAPRPRAVRVGVSMRATRWPASGIRPYRNGEVRIAEITSLVDLHAEGRAMSHCVATYADRARQGSCSLWSLTSGRRRRLTVEIRSHGRAVVQVRGPANRAPEPSELEHVLAWADRAGLWVPRGIV